MNYVDELMVCINETCQRLERLGHTQDLMYLSELADPAYESGDVSALICVATYAHAVNQQLDNEANRLINQYDRDCYQ
jgi:hypothetical protein